MNNQPSILKGMEKKRKKERRRIARLFFDEMEKNILDSISRGEVVPGIPFKETQKEGPPKEPSPKSHVRTISAMHGILLEELEANPKTSRQDHYNNKLKKYQKASSQKGRGQNSVPTKGRPPLPGRDLVQSTSSSSCNKTPQSGINSDKELSPQGMEDRTDHPTAEQSNLDPMGQKVGHTRRNTEGTIHIQSTMTNPDIKATIKCVCGVFRAHIRQSIGDKYGAQKKKAQSSLEFDVFDDHFDSSRQSLKYPTLAEISEFYETFYQRSQMEHDTIIFSLIYAERLVKSTNGLLAPSPENWRSLLFSCMILSSKVWDDLSMWNYDFANVTAHTVGLRSFTLSRINELELALLKCLKYNVKVPASEYAKYYFLIRTMQQENGLVKENKKPSGKRDASQKIEILKSLHFDQCSTKESRDRRSKSMDGSILKAIPQGAMSEIQY
jgi:hypothetical protein